MGQVFTWTHYVCVQGGVHICRVANPNLAGFLNPKPIKVTVYQTVDQWSDTISTLEGQGSISCGQYLDRTLGKFLPLYGPHLYKSL